MKKLIVILLVVATMGMAEENTKVVDTQSSTNNSVQAVTNTASEDKSALDGVAYVAGGILGAVAYVGVAVITAPVHLFQSK